MIRGASYTIDLIFNAEYTTTRVSSMILTIGNYDVCSLASGSIVRTGQHFMCSIPSDVTAVLPVGERSVTLTMNDTTDGVRKAVIATVPVQNTGSQYENENISETANMTLELTYMVNNISADLLITDVTALRAIAAAAAALVSETNAATSETNAGISETNAAQSESDTEGYMNTVQGLHDTVVADAAQVALDRIATGEDAAQTALDRIATGQDAQTATTKAGEASDSASAALQSKNYASGYADAAEQSKIDTEALLPAERLRRSYGDLQLSPFQGGAEHLEFPSIYAVKFTGINYLSFDNNNRLVTLAATSFPITLTSPSDNSYALVLDTSKTHAIDGVKDVWQLDGANAAVSWILYTGYDSTKHILLAYSYAGFGINQNAGPIGKYYTYKYLQGQLTPLLKTTKRRLNKTELVAHRGLQAVAPENTLEACRAAAEYGYKYIEFDVQRSSDGQYMIMHDDTVDRTTDGTGTLTAMTYAALRALNANYSYSDFSFCLIPTLDEYLNACKIYGLVPHIELKNTFSLARCVEIAAIVRTYFDDIDVEYHSFDITTIGYMKSTSPNATCLWAAGNLVAGNYATIVAAGLDGIMCTTTYLASELLLFTNAHMTVSFYTVNEDTILNYRNDQATFILTNNAIFDLPKGQTALRKSLTTWANFNLNGNTATANDVAITANGVDTEVTAGIGSVVRVTGEAYGDASSIMTIERLISNTSQGIDYTLPITASNWTPFIFTKINWNYCDEVKINFTRTAGTLYLRNVKINVVEI